MWLDLAEWSAERLTACQCQSRNNPAFNPSVNLILGAADEAVLNKNLRVPLPLTLVLHLYK
jgi:hypothetical protein